MTTASIENYIKEIYLAQEEYDEVKPSMLSRRMNIRPASVTGMLTRLHSLGYINYTPYKSIRLNAKGRKTALRILRRHRLIELFLVKVLKLSWDSVHAEAEEWEHVVSESVIDRMDAILEFPTRDPHGAPIPDKDGNIVRTDLVPLSELAEGEQVRVMQVSDKDTDLLRYLEKIKLLPGSKITILQLEPSGGLVYVRVNKTTITLSDKVSQQIFVEK